MFRRFWRDSLTFHHHFEVTNRRFDWSLKNKPRRHHPNGTLKKCFMRQQNRHNNSVPKVDVQWTSEKRWCFFHYRKLNTYTPQKTNTDGPKIAMFERTYILNTIILGIYVRFQGWYPLQRGHFSKEKDRLETTIFQGTFVSFRGSIIIQLHKYATLTKNTTAIAFSTICKSNSITSQSNYINLKSTYS